MPPRKKGGGKPASYYKNLDTDEEKEAKAKKEQESMAGLSKTQKKKLLSKKQSPAQYVQSGGKKTQDIGEGKKFSAAKDVSANYSSGQISGVSSASPNSAASPSSSSSSSPYEGPPIPATATPMSGKELYSKFQGTKHKGVKTGLQPKPKPPVFNTPAPAVTPAPLPTLDPSASTLTSSSFFFSPSNPMHHPSSPAAVSPSGMTPSTPVSLPSNLAGPSSSTPPQQHNIPSPGSTPTSGIAFNSTPPSASDKEVSMTPPSPSKTVSPSILHTMYDFLKKSYGVGGNDASKEVISNAAENSDENEKNQKTVADPLGSDPTHNVPTSKPTLGPSAQTPSSSSSHAASGNWSGGTPSDTMGVQSKIAVAPGGGFGNPPSMAPMNPGEKTAEKEKEQEEEIEIVEGEGPTAPAPSPSPSPSPVAAAQLGGEGGGGGGGGERQVYANKAGAEGGFRRPASERPIGTPIEQLLNFAQHGPNRGGPNEGQGDYHPPPYGDGSAFAEKARESDSDRTHPITPATGSRQTPSTANSIIGADPVIASARKLKPEKVLGTAQERANVGQGQYSGYEFSGPYDFPTRPSGRPDTSLTAVGGWRSKQPGHSSSLWRSTVTEKGSPAKRDKYYRWSTKGAGGWKDLSSRDAMKTFTKMEAKKQGGRWMDRPNPGEKLTSMMAGTLKRKMADINEGRAGNERMNKRKKGNDPANNYQAQM